MILTCPACATRYLTDPALLGAAGRMVRCAKCGHSWMQAPPPDMPRRVEVPIPPKMESAAPAHAVPARIAEKRPPRTGWWLAFLAVAVGCAALLAWLAHVYQVTSFDRVAEIADRLIKGGPALGEGLEFSNVRFERREIDGVTSIVIEGQVFNTTPEPQPIPTLKATLQDEQGRWLSDWTFSLGRPTLESGETVGFKVTSPNPPPTTRKLEVTFTEEPPEG